MPIERAAVEAIGVTRTYEVGGKEVRGLDQVSLSVEAGEVVAVMGPSGSGKSTLLFLLGGLDEPDEGSVRVNGVDWRTLRGSARAGFRMSSCRFPDTGLPPTPPATT